MTLLGCRQLLYLVTVHPDYRAMYGEAAILFREVLDSNLSSIILGLRDVLQSFLAAEDT